mgnify:CR=1 FL=1
MREIVRWRSPNESSGWWRRPMNWAFCAIAKSPSSFSIRTTNCSNMRRRIWITYFWSTQVRHTVRYRTFWGQASITLLYVNYLAITSILSIFFEFVHILNFFLLLTTLTNFVHHLICPFFFYQFSPILCKPDSGSKLTLYFLGNIYLKSRNLSKKIESKRVDN